MSPYSCFTVTQTAVPVRVCIIGNKGRMGHMFTQLWQQAGHLVNGIDRALQEREVAQNIQDPHIHTLTVNMAPQDVANAVKQAEVVLLCVPANALPDVLALLAPCLAPWQILVDVCSVKTLPMLSMQRIHNGPVVGVHPLFGPIATKKDLVAAITPGENARGQDLAVIEGLFACIGCRTFCTTPEQHDRGVAFAQALNFASNAAYFATVAQQPDILPFITPSFRRRIEAGRKQMTEDANMFIGFIKANPQMRFALDAMRQMLDEVENGNLEPVVRQAQQWYVKNEGPEKR